MKRYAVGVTILCLMLCVSCSRRVEVPMPVVVRPTLSLHLLEPTPEPEFRGRSNGDLLEWALDNRDALRMCNSDKWAVERQWKVDE